jgi:molybdate transport system regulatory protein
MKKGNTFLALARWGFLPEIDRLGSISAAARKLGMSYRYALERITIVEKRLGHQLVDRKRGGKEEGGAKLTAFGNELLANYRGMDGSLNQFTKWYVDLSDWSSSGSAAWNRGKDRDFIAIGKNRSKCFHIAYVFTVN